MITLDFSNNQTVSPDDVAKAEKVLNGEIGNFLEPGVHAVTITAVEYKEMSDKDSTWAKFFLTMAKGDQTAKTVMLVPTTKETYEGGGKNTSFMFAKLQRFFKAVGVDLISGNPGPVIQQYFVNTPPALIGKQLEIEIGYQRDFIGYADGKYFLCKKDGSRHTTKEHESRTLAEAEAIELGLKDVEKYAGVKNFLPAQQAAESDSWGDHF